MKMSVWTRILSQKVCKAVAGLSLILGTCWHICWSGPHFEVCLVSPTPTAEHAVWGLLLPSIRKEMYQCRKDTLLVRNSQEGSRCYWDVTWLWELSSTTAENPLVMQQWVATAPSCALMKPLWNKSFSWNPTEEKKNSEFFLKFAFWVDCICVLGQSSLICCFLLFSVLTWGRGSCLHVGEKENSQVLLDSLFLTRPSPRGRVRPVLASWSFQMKVFHALPSSSMKAKEYVKRSCQSCAFRDCLYLYVTQEQAQFSLPGYPVISIILHFPSKSSHLWKKGKTDQTTRSLCIG